MSAKLRKSARRAFTLIEFLVSISIILLLAGIIFVAARSAIRAAKSSACLTNLRQLGTAYELYVADTGGYVPPYVLEDFTDMANIKFLANPGMWKASLERYGPTDQQFYCPLDDIAHTKGHKRFELIDHTFTSYAFGPGLTVLRETGVNYLKLNVSSLTDPSRTVLLLDDGWFSGQKDYDLTAHGESRNLLFFDSHVKEVSTHVPPCWFPGQQKGC